MGISLSKAKTPPPKSSSQVVRNSIGLRFSLPLRPRWNALLRTRMVSPDLCFKGWRLDQTPNNYLPGSGIGLVHMRPWIFQRGITNPSTAFPEPILVNCPKLAAFGPHSLVHMKSLRLPKILGLSHHWAVSRLTGSSLKWALHPLSLRSDSFTIKT